MIVKVILGQNKPNGCDFEGDPGERLLHAAAGRPGAEAHGGEDHHGVQHHRPSPLLSGVHRSLSLEAQGRPQRHSAGLLEATTSFYRLI